MERCAGTVADGVEPGAVIGPLIDMKAVEKARRTSPTRSEGRQGRHRRQARRAGRQLLRADGADRCDDRRGHHQGGDLRPGRPALSFQRPGGGHQDGQRHRIRPRRRDIGRIWRVAEALEYGIVGINEGIISPKSRWRDRPLRRHEGKRHRPHLLAHGARNTASRNSSRGVLRGIIDPRARRLIRWLPFLFNKKWSGPTPASDPNAVAQLSLPTQVARQPVAEVHRAQTSRHRSVLSRRSQDAEPLRAGRSRRRG
jgi:hypothetical protein